MKAFLRMSSAAMATGGIAFLIAHSLPPLLGVCAAVVVAVPVYFFSMRISYALEPGDYWRMSLAVKRLPKGVADAFEKLLRVAIPNFAAALPKVESSAESIGASTR
jgi:hypothetical protein